MQKQDMPAKSTTIRPQRLTTGKAHTTEVYIALPAKTPRYHNPTILLLNYHTHPAHLYSLLHYFILRFSSTGLRTSINRSGGGCVLLEKTKGDCSCPLSSPLWYIAKHGQIPSNSNLQQREQTSQK